MISNEKAKLIEQKAKDFLCASPGFSLLLAEVYQASDWTCSLHKCLEGIVNTLDSISQLSNSLTEAINREGMVSEIRIKLAGELKLFAALSSEYSVIVDRYTRSLTGPAKEKIKAEFVHHWERIEQSLEKAQASLKRLKARAMMVGIWDDPKIEPLHPLFDRIISMSLSNIQDKFENGELAFGDDIHALSKYLEPDEEDD